MRSTLQKIFIRSLPPSARVLRKQRYSHHSEQTYERRNSIQNVPRTFPPQDHGVRIMHLLDFHWWHRDSYRI
jgi:hypothetical protein